MKAKEITLGGVLIALSLLILYSASILHVSTISILTLSSAIVPICIIRSDIKTATLVFVATSIISFYIIPINIWLLYILIFGGYGIVKYLIERMRKEFLENIFKFIYSNIIFILSIMLAKILLDTDVFVVFSNIIGKYIKINGPFIPVIGLYIFWQVVFFLFDYALTLIITFYMERLHKKY